MKKIKTLMVVGAGLGQVPAIKEGRKLGYRVIAIDRNPEALGMPLADISLVVDTTDIRKALRVAKQYKVDGVMTMQTDISVPTVGRIVDELGLPGCGYDLAMRCSSKIMTREYLAKKDVPQPEFRVVSDLSQTKEAALAIGFPCVVKSPDSSGSRGVVKVSAMAGVPEAFKEAKKYAKSKILVEEYISGIEIGAQSFSVNGKCKKVLVHNDTVSNPPYMVPVGHSFPSYLKPSELKGAEAAVAKAIEAIGIEDGPANIDLIIDKRGVAKIIEIGARIGATCLPELVYYFTGINWTGEAIKSAMGGEVNLTAKKKQPCAALILESPRDGVLLGYEVDPAVVKDKNVIDFEISAKLGEEVNVFRKGTDRIGSIVVKDSTVKKAEARAKKIRDMIRFKVGR